MDSFVFPRQITTGTIYRAVFIDPNDPTGLPSSIFRFRRYSSQVEELSEFHNRHVCSAFWADHPVVSGPEWVLKHLRRLGRGQENAVYKADISRLTQSRTLEGEAEAIQVEVWHWPEESGTLEEDPHVHIIFSQSCYGQPDLGIQRPTASVRRQHLKLYLDRCVELTLGPDLDGGSTV